MLHPLAIQPIVLPTLKTALEKLVEGNIEAALNVCHWISDYRPEEGNTVFVLALAHDFRGRRFGKLGHYGAAEKAYEIAIHHFTRFLDQHPDSHFSTLAADRRGQLRLALGFPDAIAGAIKDFSQVIDQEPTNTLAYLNRGQAYFQRYDFDAAISDLDRSISLDEKQSAPYELKGEIALLHSEEEAGHRLAVHQFRKARAYCENLPTEMRLQLFEAAAEYLDERYDEAKALLREIETHMEKLRGWDWHEFRQKVDILQSRLEMNALEVIEAPTPDIVARREAKSDVLMIFRKIRDFFCASPPLVPA